MRSNAKKRIVETYIEGFRTGDHELILGCLTDDVHFRDDRISRLVTYQVDRLPGDQTRRAFDA
jgi:hypothetical protein